MKITGPQPVTASTSSPSAFIDFHLDLDTGLVTVIYRPTTATGPGFVKRLQHAAPAALITAIKAHIQTSIEAAEGWAAGSSTLS